MNFPDIHPALTRALATRGYTDPTSVQSAVLATDAAGRDLLVSAQTGSGKTVAYGLAFATDLLGEALRGGSERFPRATAPQALIVAPTRELALQVHGELAWLYAETGARIIACIGGMDARREQRQLEGGCHIVVGTPGRLRDHLERRQLDVTTLRVLVLDEADEMLDMGFREDLEFILETTPSERRTMLFSATIARDIASLARRYQRDALRIDTIAHDKPHADIEYRAVRIAPGELEGALVNVLRHEDARATLVFCATRDAVRTLHASLVTRGFDAVCLSGELSQQERNQALQSLRDGRARVCVATDVAARGLDLPDLNLVIHADLPTDRETLLHRSGRTGRAGRKGVCVLIVPHSRRKRAEQLISFAGLTASWAGPPSAEAIRARDQDRLLTDPILTEPATPADLTLARLLLAGRDAEDIAAALIRLHRSRLPAPTEIFGAAPALHEGSYGKTDTPRAPRERRAELGNTSWFRIPVGRHANADPKWILPLICRLGNLTKQDIGAIRIFDRETKFEIAAAAVPGFTASLSQQVEAEVAIEPTIPPGDATSASRPDARPFRRDDQRPKKFQSARPKRAKA